MTTAHPLYGDNDGSMRVIVVMGEAGELRAIVPPGSTISVGRDKYNDIVCTNNDVDNKHAYILNAGFGCVVGDYNTQHGTFCHVGGSRHRLGSTESTYIYPPMHTAMPLVGFSFGDMPHNYLRLEDANHIMAVRVLCGQWQCMRRFKIDCSPFVPVPSDPQKRCLFDIACERSNFKAVQFCLDMLDVNPKLRWDTYRLRLVGACRSGNVALMRLLSAHTAFKHADMEDCLMLALKEKQDDVVKMVLQTLRLTTERLCPMVDAVAGWSTVTSRLMFYLYHPACAQGVCQGDILASTTNMLPAAVVVHALRSGCITRCHCCTDTAVATTHPIFDGWTPKVHHMYTVPGRAAIHCLLLALGRYNIPANVALQFVLRHVWHDWWGRSVAVP